MQAWLITDPMGEFIIFDEEANKDEEVNYEPLNKFVLTFNRNEKTLIWDLKEEIGSGRVSTKVLGDGKTQTTYTLTYRVKLDTSDLILKKM